MGTSDVLEGFLQTLKRMRTRKEHSGRVRQGRANNQEDMGSCSQADRHSGGEQGSAQRGERVGDVGEGASCCWLHVARRPLHGGGLNAVHQWGRRGGPGSPGEPWEPLDPDGQVFSQAFDWQASHVDGFCCPQRDLIGVQGPSPPHRRQASNLGLQGPRCERARADGLIISILALCARSLATQPRRSTRLPLGIHSRFLSFYSVREGLQWSFLLFSVLIRPLSTAVTCPCDRVTVNIGADGNTHSLILYHLFDFILPRHSPTALKVPPPTQFSIDNTSSRLQPSFLRC